MSLLKVNKVSPQSGTDFTLGDSGDTFTVPSGVTLTVAGTFTQTGAQTFDGGVDIDNFNINGTTITLSSGDMTLDVAGDIVLDADGGDVFVKDGGTTFGSLTNTSGNLIIKSGTTTAATFSGANVTLAGTVGSGAITSTGIVTGTAFTAGSAVLAEAELELLDGLTAGTAIASKVVTTDANIDSTGMRNLTISGELDAATGDFSGAVDIAGALTSSATATITVADNSDVLILKSTDADANVGPILSLHRDSANPADNDITGRINFRADNDAGEAIDYASMFCKLADVTDGTEDFKLIIQGKKAGTDVNILQIGEDEVIINEDSNDVDFRVESNANTHMLFVDGGNNRVGIGTTPDLGAGLHIRTADSGASVSANADELIIEGSGNTGITIASGNDSGGNIFFADDGGIQQGKIQYDHDANAMSFRTNNVDRVKIHSNGVAAFNNGIALGVSLNNTASNVLNDYEEGTFTPAYAFGSGSAGMNSGSRGDYVKVGNLVHFQVFIATDSTSSPSGDATITGLPFTTGDNTSSSAAIGLLYRFETDFDGDLKVRVGQDSTVLSPFKNASSSTSATRLQGGDLKAGSNTAWNNLHVAGCYSTA